MVELEIIFTFDYIFGFSKDWSAGAQTINYVAARQAVPQTGAVIGDFLDWLHENDLVDFSQVTIVGFSLGGEYFGFMTLGNFCFIHFRLAHVAGMAGKAVTRGRVNTIVGLDPAGD